MGYNVAIDGPAGCRKKVRLPNGLRKKKGYIYVDTGAMYRALAVYFLDKKIIRRIWMLLPRHVKVQK